MKITIPPAAELAGAQAYEDTYRTGASHRNSLRAAFEAMVGAWPDMAHRVMPYSALILPLTEKPDA